MHDKRGVRVALVLLGLFGSACASSQPEPIADTQSGMSCVDDSPRCIEQRQSAFRAIMADRERRWVREPATPEAYASGVRLFAFKGRKKELTCDELSHGRREADAAPGILRGSVTGQLTPAQISRGTMLAAEVSKELGVEMKRRCRA